jgi:hypothetical protein
VPPGGAWTAASVVRQSSADLRLPGQRPVRVRASRRSERGREQPAYLVGVRARPGCVADRGCALSARAAWPGPPRRVPGGVGQGSRALRCPWALAARVRGRGPLPAPVRAVRACRAPGVWCARCRTRPARPPRRPAARPARCPRGVEKLSRESLFRFEFP